MIDKKQKYIITLLVDNREWNSQPIEGKLKKEEGTNKKGKTN